MARRKGNGSLRTYRQKRRFPQTPEPAGKLRAAGMALRFVVQRHAARRLHYDFRLEWRGVLRSWAVPKGPSIDPAIKRLAVQVEDHPIEYGDFEGTIPKGHYGAGRVEIWDRGAWLPQGDVEKGLREGHLSFFLEGRRLHGRWALARLKSARGQPKQWLLMKVRDGAAVKSARLTRIPTAKPARRAALAQEILEPQLATAVAAAPTDGDWYSELKLDGYRLLAHVDGEEVRCFSRSGLDWSAKLPRIVADLLRLKLQDTWLDGELVAIDEQRHSQFQLLQQKLDSGDDAVLLYYVFDILRSKGRDTRDLSLEKRRAELARALRAKAEGRRVQLLEYSEAPAPTLLERICEQRLEGLVLKDKSAPYRAGRNTHWLKLKCRREQEFVIGGYTRVSGGRDSLTALLLGYFDAAGKLRFAGRAGSGFDTQTLATLRAKLDRLTRTTTPFDPKPDLRRSEKPVWVAPKLVAQVRFAGWTEQGLLRQPLYVGLRADLKARRVSGRPEPLAVKEKAARMKPAPGDARLTHPDRVLFPGDGVTKRELAAYFEAVQELLWPELEQRPLSLLRAIEHGQIFTQRHLAAGSKAPGLAETRRAQGARRPYFMCVDTAALATLAQWGSVELHTWGTRAPNLSTADRLTFDLDPDPALRWRTVRDAALLVRELLQSCELESFLKTTGGAGLHVVVPLAEPRPAWKQGHEFARQLASHLALTFPELFTVKAGARNRPKKIYIDYQRNREAATTVAAYSPRYRPGVPVSMPIAWGDLTTEDLRGAHFNLRGAIASIELRARDPWADYARTRQRLTRTAAAQLNKKSVRQK